VDGNRCVDLPVVLSLSLRDDDQSCAPLIRFHAPVGDFAGPGILSLHSPLDLVEKVRTLLPAGTLIDHAERAQGSPARH
jgi:hypothetical protein